MVSKRRFLASIVAAFCFETAGAQVVPIEKTVVSKKLGISLPELQVDPVSISEFKSAATPKVKSTNFYILKFKEIIKAGVERAEIFRWKWIREGDLIAEGFVAINNGKVVSTLVTTIS